MLMFQISFYGNFLGFSWQLLHLRRKGLRPQTSCAYGNVCTDINAFDTSFKTKIHRTIQIMNETIGSVTSEQIMKETIGSFDVRAMRTTLTSRHVNRQLAKVIFKIVFIMRKCLKCSKSYYEGS